MSIRVLVIRAGALGDTVFSSSILPVLDEQFGEDLVVEWAGKPLASAMFRDDTRVQRIWTIAHNNLPLLLNPDKLHIVFSSWSRPYDLVVNLENSNKYNRFMQLIRARNKRGKPFDYFEDIPRLHAVDFLKQIYARFATDKALEQTAPQLVASSPATTLARFQLTAGSYIVINPGVKDLNKAGKSLRTWPMSHWPNFITSFHQKTGKQVVIIGSKAEAESAASLRSLEGVRFLAGTTTINELIDIVSESALMVSADSGPSHIAGALNIPVLALFGPSIPERTAPFSSPNNQVEVIRAGLDCSPCRFTEREENCSDNRCMQEILPENVVTSALAMLK
jgi:ADP-heptose:LPS heptosyltransferase